MKAKLEGDIVILTPETFEEQCWFVKVGVLVAKNIDNKKIATIDAIHNPNRVEIEIPKLPGKVF